MNFQRRHLRRLHWDASHRARAEGGFALIELLIVVAIIVVMFTLYFGGGTLRRDQTRQMAACRKNLANIFVALKAYSIDNNDKFPTLAGAKTSEAPLSLLVPKSTTSTEFFICPGSSDKPLPEAQPFAERKISYAYYMGLTAKDGADVPLVSDRQINADPKPAGQWVFSYDGKKPGNNHDKFGGNILFCDGDTRPTTAVSAFALTNGTNVVLLNPKP